MVAVSESRRRTEVLRVLHRYLTEIVERYDLCPWARVAREKGEVAIDVLWGTPTVDQWVAASERVLGQKGAKVAMIVAPELVIDPGPLHSLRGEVSARVPSAGIAEFHPAASLDLGSPARLVPFVRRSPDPLLQLVPLSILSSVRTPRMVVDVYEQAQILNGTAALPRQDAADRIADNNHATVSAAHATMIATLEDIAEDRRRSYELVGISASR
jgi:hypothetical protein